MGEDEQAREALHGSIRGKDRNSKPLSPSVTRWSRALV